jgi:hypothetical protein
MTHDEEAPLTSPRIKLMSCRRVWSCSGGGATGYGLTVTGAYANWLVLMSEEIYDV